MKNKLNAFTLIDVLSAMLISSIIIGAALYFFLFVQENQNEFKNTSNSKYKIELAYETLNRLFLKADNIEHEGSEITFTEDDRNFTATLESDLLILYTGKSDSLNWDLIDVKTSRIKGKNTLKSLRIEFNFDTKAFEWYFYKNFGKSTQIEIVER